MTPGSSGPAAGRRSGVPVLLHVFPSFAVGGQQRRFATIAGGLAQPLRHVIVSLDGRTEATGLLAPEVAAERAAVAPAPGLRAPWAAARALRRIGPDVLVTYNWGSIDWAIGNRLAAFLPHIHLEDGFGPEEADRQLPRRVLARRIVLRRALVVVPSHTLARIATQVWRLPPERISIIPNGIDARRFAPAPSAGPAPFARDCASAVIGAVAPLRKEKNLARLLRAFAGLDPAARLVICGDGPEAAPLATLAGALGIADRVTFTGHVRAPEQVMAHFDVFAITSDTEQMPYAVLEAMAAGVPVVGTDVGDIARMVHAENRPFIVPRDAPDRLAGALAALLADAPLRARLGAANRAEVLRRFTVEQMTVGFAAVLDRALARAPA